MAAIRRFGDVQATDMLVVADKRYEVEAADKAGRRTVGDLCGGFAEADLRHAG